MEKSLTISNWLRSGEYHTLIDSVYTKIIRNCESSRNESQTASVFETEISFLVRNQLGIELYFSKEENVDGIVHKFAGLTSRQSGHGRLDAVVNDIVIEYKHMTNYLFFDTETTGVPRNYKAPSSDTRNWPRLVQLACVLCWLQPISAGYLGTMAINTPSCKSCIGNSLVRILTMPIMP